MLYGIDAVFFNLQTLEGACKLSAAGGCRWPDVNVVRALRKILLLLGAGRTDGTVLSSMKDTICTQEDMMAVDE